MNTFEPIESVNLGDRAIEAIRGAIIRGALGPCESLSDRRLAADLGVSRTPVRDALHRLQAEGLVEPRGRSGWAVTDFTEQDVRELFDLRILLEPFGIDLLASAPNPELLESIARHWDDFTHPVPVDRREEYFARDDDFHMRIVEASGNRRLASFYSVLKAHINRGRYLLSGTRADRLEQTLDEHWEIATALRARDFDRAREALIAHLRTGEELLIQQLRSNTAKAAAG